MKTSMTVHRLIGAPGDIEAMRSVLTRPENDSVLRDDLTPEWYEAMEKDLREGRVLAYLLRVAEEPMAVVWGRATDSGILMCHLAVGAPARGWTTFGLARACCGVAFAEHPDVRCLMGIIPSSRPGAFLVAVKAGFRRVAALPGLFADGEAAILMARMRDDE